MESALVIVVMITLAFIFPIGAAYYAYKKNRQGWAIATIAATFVGAGWLVGVIAIIVPAKSVKGEMGTQCPQCAGRQGSTLTITVSRETGQPVRSSFLAIAALVGGFAVCILAGWMAVGLTRNPLPANSNVGSACGTVGFMISIGGTMIGWGAKTLRQRKAGTAKAAKYTCDACGHQWQQELPSQRGVPKRIEELSHQDPDTRRAAANALDQVGEPQAVPSLEVIWNKLQNASAGSLSGSNNIIAIAILYENPRNIALPEKRKLAEILVGQYRGPDFIPNSLFIEQSTRITARKLVYGKEISETAGLDTSESNKILAEMLAASTDLSSVENTRAMAFTGDSPALGQTFFALLTNGAAQVTIPKSQPSQPSSVEKSAVTSQRNSRSTHARLKWILIVGAAVVVAMIGIPLGIGLMSGILGGAPTPTPGPTPMGGGGQIAFVSERDGNPETYVMDPSGSGVTRLTDDPANDLDPAWSPDRQRIAFVSDLDGNPEIYVMNADGSDVMRLTDNPASESAPVWSPDGQRIAFVTDRDGNFEIYIMHSDGSGAENLTSNSAFDISPAWSPDGKRIAFSSWRDEGLKIYIMDADGSDVQRLTEGQTLDCSPIWSPSGQHIAFVSGRGNAQDDKPFVSAHLLENGKMFATTGDVFDVRSVKESIHVMSADGSGVTQLTEGWAPAWSPDGQHIVFVSDRTDTIGIYVANPNGSNVTRLTDSQVSDYAPAWGASPVQVAAIPVASVPSPTPKPAERATNTPSPAPTSTHTPPPTATPTSTPSPAPTSTRTPPPTATRTSTPSPVPTTTPVTTSPAGGDVILVDTFDSNAAGWPTGERDSDWCTLDWQITGGRYRWNVDTHQGVHWYVYPDMARVSDFNLAVEAQQISGTNDSNYGVVFRVVDNKNFYRFAINSSQEFILSCKYKDEWIRLIDWTRSPAINPGEMNQLMVVAQGSHFALYINDQPVGEADDDKLPSGKTGLDIEVHEADEQAVFEFDNFELRHLSAQEASSFKKVIVTGDPIRSMALSPDGSILAVAGKESGVQLWNTETGQIEFTLTGYTGRTNDLAFTPDGKTLASAGNDDTTKLWDAVTGQMLHSLGGHTLWVYRVAFSPDGKILASGSTDRTVRLWDVATGQELRVLSGHTDWVYRATFSPKGDLLATGSCRELEEPGSAECVTGEIVLWNVETGQAQHTIYGHEGRVISLAFSPDGRILASGSDDEAIHLWDTNTGQKIATLDGHKSWVNSLAFSPDGRILASGSGDGTVRLWDPVTGRVLDSLRDHPSWVISIAFTADGRTLASANEAGKVILWPVTQGQ